MCYLRYATWNCVGNGITIATGTLNHMQLKSNIPDIIERLERLKISVGAAGSVPPIPDFSDAMFSAINSGMGLMKQRIFNRGEDADGNSLGKYVGKKTNVTAKKFGGNKKLQKNFIGEGALTEYEKFRVAHGRQVAYKDLEVDGSLRRSIETVKDSNGKVTIAIVNPETARIAGYQEEQIGKIRGTGIARIFSLSESEYNHVKAEGNEAIRQVINRLVTQ